MTHRAQKAPVPAISSTSSAVVESPDTDGSTKSNDIKEEASVEAPAALLKQEKGWKVEEKGWKEVPNTTPAKNQTKYKEEYGYIVTNKRYSRCHMCSSLYLSYSSIPFFLMAINPFTLDGLLFCVFVCVFFYVLCSVNTVCGTSMCVSTVPSLCLMAFVFWWP